MLAFFLIHPLKTHTEPYHSRPSICVENAMRLSTVCVFVRTSCLPHSTHIALFILMKSNSINTCQRYGVFELNTQFTIKSSYLIRTFLLIRSYFRYPARSYRRDIVFYINVAEGEKQPFSVALECSQSETAYVMCKRNG